METQHSNSKLIDIHTHILPQIDDGSQAVTQSIEQLKLMNEAGVTDVICTPHYITNFYENNKEKIKQAAEKLIAEMRSENIPIKLHLAAEVLLNSKSLENIETEKLTVNETNYVLVESEMSGFPADFKENLYYLIKAGFKPILAHPERYSEVKRNPEIVEDLMHRNVLMQINAGSLLGHYGKECRKTAWKLLRSGWVHFMASDNHCRNPEYALAEAKMLVEHKIDQYTAEMLTYDNPRKLLENEKINIFYLSDEKLESRKSLWSKLMERFGK